jgi:hypothetical protein
VVRTTVRGILLGGAKRAPFTTKTSTDAIDDVVTQRNSFGNELQIAIESLHWLNRVICRIKIAAAGSRALRT